MVDQALRAALAPHADEAILDALFADDPEPLAHLPEPDRAALRDRIAALKVIDPACGSGAFPMGLLNRMVDLLGRLGDTRTDYARKLDLIEHAIYGVDIQPIAIQISKLRFFIALLCDQTPDPDQPNAGLDQLPNLETHLVIANSLIGFDEGGDNLLGGSKRHASADKQTVITLREKLEDVRRKYVRIHSRKDKLALRREDETLRRELSDRLKTLGFGHTDLLAKWKPYDPGAVSPFFDPQWMFGLDKFDIVIGNPPYFVIKSDTPCRDAYSQRFAALRYGRTNIYQCFIGLLGALLSPTGVATYIHPKTLLGDSYLSATRAWLLKQFSDVEILNIADRRNTFENVLQSVIVTIWKQMGRGNAMIRVVNDKENIETSRALTLPLSQIVTPDGRFLVADSPLTYSILQKVSSMPARHCAFVTGKVQWDKMTAWLTDKPNANAKRLLFGENIQRYVFRESRRRAPYSFITIKNVEVLKLPAIVAQRVTAIEQERRIIATLVTRETESASCIGENHVITFSTKTNDDGYFILGVLNSRFVDWYFRLFNSNTQVASGELNRIPIPLHNTRTLCDTVRNVLEKRAQGMDTTEEERAIDDEVYRLYGLTEEEVALVERAFAKDEKPAPAKVRAVADADEEV